MATNPDITALNQLKDASLWFIIATLIGLVGVVSSLSAVVSIVTFIILLFVALPKLKDAFNNFLQTGKDVRNGITGANILPWAFLLIFIGGIIGIVGIFILSFILATISILLIVLGAILEFVAGLLIGLSIYNLGKFYQSDLMWIGGIIIIIPGINFVGWILTYISIDDILRRLGYVQQPVYLFAQSGIYQPSISIYQVGTGRLTPDGKAQFILYSSSQVQILNASIDNTLISASGNSIMPQMLNQGNNTVVIQFPIPFSGFIPGNVYTITVTLSNGQATKVFVTYG